LTLILAGHWRRQEAEMRRIALAFAAALALVFGGLSANAAQPINSSITGAEAHWYFVDQGGAATGVMIRPVREVDSATGHAITVGVNVQVEQAYIDPTTGEDVFRLLVSEPYYSPATSISVDRAKGASVQAAVNLYDQSSGAGPYRVTVAADWTPVGDTTRTLSNVWDTEGGMWWLRRSHGTSTPAIATGSMTGVLNYGSLGEAEGILATGHDFNKFIPPPMYTMVKSMLDVYTAEGRDTFHISGANSTWDLGDPRATSVILGVTQNRTAAGAHSVAEVSLEIYAGYHDPATNEDVWYDVSGEASVPEGAVDPSLQRASVSVTVTVSGYELRSLTGSTHEPTETPLGPLPMTITAEWTATGPIAHYRTLFMEKGVDFSYKKHYYDRARQAAATGSIAGSLISAALTNVQNAFMYDETETVTAK
jgi:hypothetical protein